MTFWLYVLFSILLKCNFSHINFVHYLVAKVPIHFRIKLMTLCLISFCKSVKKQGDSGKSPFSLTVDLDSQKKKQYHIPDAAWERV